MDEVIITTNDTYGSVSSDTIYTTGTTIGTYPVQHYVTNAPNSINNDVVLDYSRYFGKFITEKELEEKLAEQASKIYDILSGMDKISITKEEWLALLEE